MAASKRDEKALAEAQELRTVNLPARFSWVVLGGLVMGSIAVGAVLLAQKTNLIKTLDPILQFWIFELATGVGFFFGALGMALLSSGRTTREPVYAAMLAFAAQTGYLLVSESMTGLGVSYFLLLLILSGTMAYAGAWMGEKLTGEA